ncbi:MAG: hypothetical protein J0L97_10315 [Alphaproteobacteria bacterium]|nr:hypothetical protein [Alphaproteobacteria bacterium]
MKIKWILLAATLTGCTTIKETSSDIMNWADCTFPVYTSEGWSKNCDPKTNTSNWDAQQKAQAEAQAKARAAQPQQQQPRGTTSDGFMLPGTPSAAQP